jgi:hypothetical protein
MESSNKARAIREDANLRFSFRIESQKDYSHHGCPKCSREWTLQRTFFGCRLLVASIERLSCIACASFGVISLLTVCRNRRWSGPKMCIGGVHETSRLLYTADVVPHPSLSGRAAHLF